MAQEEPKGGFNYKAAIEKPKKTLVEEDEEQELMSEYDGKEHREEEVDELYTDMEEND